VAEMQSYWLEVFYCPDGFRVKNNRKPLFTVFLPIRTRLFIFELGKKYWKRPNYIVVCTSDI